jgi:hypothetical protein
MLRDQNLCDVTSSLITRNHLFGLNAAWDCTLTVTSSVVGGNGGFGVSVNYDSFFRISETSLAHNRERGIHVGSWCTLDSLYAERCWWGETPPAADSTGMNLHEIWDGRDEPGRAIVQFTPWLETTPGAPAPSSLVPIGGEYIQFSSVEPLIDDTLFVDLVPNQDHSPAQYAPLAIASSLDTILCFTVYDLSQEGGLYRGRLVLVETADELTPDQLEFADGDLNAWWLSDSTVLGAVRSQSVVPTVFELAVAPNPFHTATVFSWYTPGPSLVRIEIYDLVGRRLWRSETLPEQGDLVFDAGNIGSYSLPPGIYVSILKSTSGTVAAPVVKLR